MRYFFYAWMSPLKGKDETKQELHDDEQERKRETTRNKETTKNRACIFMVICELVATFFCHKLFLRTSYYKLCNTK